MNDWRGSRNKKPWNQKDFELHMRLRDHIGMVVEYKEAVIAHFIYQLREKSLCIKYMVVNPDWQRQGVGTAILNKLKSKLSSARRKRIKIIVSDKNLGFHLLLKKNGFIATKSSRNKILFVYEMVAAG
jgi:GNAT superfamily N-acetyltransferase